MGDRFTYLLRVSGITRHPDQEWIEGLRAPRDMKDEFATLANAQRTCARSVCCGGQCRSLANNASRCAMALWHNGDYTE
jgi:hypothetical protein